MARKDAKAMLAELDPAYMDLDRPKKSRESSEATLNAMLAEDAEKVANLTGALVVTRGLDSAGRKALKEALKESLKGLARTRRCLCALNVAGLLAEEREAQEEIEAELVHL